MAETHKSESTPSVEQLVQYPLSRAAAIAGVHPRTVKRWCEAGRLAYRTVQGRRFIRHVDLAAFLEGEGA